MFNIILALDEKYGIGYNNKLPWTCATDLKHFKEKTTGHILIVGRKTWESMPQKSILKTRNVIIVSSTLNTASSGVCVCKTLNDALHTAYNYKFKDQLVFVIGGLQLYNDALCHSHLDTIVVTHIKGMYTCDTYAHCFKEIIEKWNKNNTLCYDDCTIITYSKVDFTQP